MDTERFAAACEAAACRERAGIGTQGERGVHSALKHYFQPDVSCHEVTVGGYIADAVCEEGVVEVQTRSFYRMKEKLERFLEVTSVTVVYPCVAKKRVFRISPETGEVLSKRLSPKHCAPISIFGELRGIAPLLTQPGLRICIAVLEAEEYRPAQPRTRKRRGAASGVELMPTALLGEVWFHSPEDYRQFIPQELMGKIFTAAQLAQSADVNKRLGTEMAYVLTTLGLLRRAGRQGRAMAYEVVDFEGERECK